MTDEEACAAKAEAVLNTIIGHTSVDCLCVTPKAVDRPYAECCKECCIAGCNDDNVWDPCRLTGEPGSMTRKSFEEYDRFFQRVPVPEERNDW